MACIKNISYPHVESEMEEGEIVDELDDLSDISSEEEFLLRQRLEVLENYNNVLERKEAKRTTETPGKSISKDDGLCDLSEVSTSELEEICRPEPLKKEKHSKSTSRQKIRKDATHDLNHDLTRKKTHRKKKKVHLKIISESSEESDDEYRNKRRRLANAVTVHENNCDKSTLKTRLNNMLHGVHIDPIIRISKQTEQGFHIPAPNFTEKQISLTNTENESIETRKELSKENIYIDLSSDENVKDCQIVESIDSVDGISTNKEAKKINVDSNKNIDEKRDSDEDLELLRQHALKTKTAKAKEKQETIENKPINSEDEDSDTAELRLICLKSALLKKAIEIKQKQKLQKKSGKISLSSNLQGELLLEEQDLSNSIENENNTDIESVDMDIGSDVEEKGKDLTEDSAKNNQCDEICDMDSKEMRENVQKPKASRQEELDEDEDLLRAKLLTSLSKNLPNLIEPNEFTKETPIKPSMIPKQKSNLPKMKSNLLKPKSNLPKQKSNIPKQNLNIPEEKKIIINLGESDSEGEHEATKNLTKMHLKLSEQVEFQNKLDLFLKSARMEVESTKLPDVVLKPPDTTQTPSKYVPKAVKHLPKSEQIEYRNLVKRMAELEKLKQVRQSAMDNLKTRSMPIKDKLQPKNVSVGDTRPMLNKHLEEQIALSRKKIADESATIMKLKEESMKLLQKFKIVATEYRNISTAISLNKKELKNAQIRLSKVRSQHQTLLKSNPPPKSNPLPAINRVTNKLNNINRIQKENYPKEEYKNSELLKNFKVSVVNDYSKPVISHNQLSVQIDLSSNKKTVKIPKSTDKDRLVDKQDNSENLECNEQIRICQQIKTMRVESRLEPSKNHEAMLLHPVDDYQSPLQSLQSMIWIEDPNAILCPFEVGGNCKDPDCKYMHPKSQHSQ